MARDCVRAARAARAVFLLVGMLCFGLAAPPSAAANDSASTLCRNSSVEQRLKEIEPSITFWQRHIESDLKDYDPTTASTDDISKMSKSLNEKRQNIADLRAEKKRLLSLPACRRYGPFVTDECVTDAVTKEIERVKKLLAAEERRLGDDEAEEKMAAASEKDAIDKDAWAHRMALAKADVAYDKTVVARLKSELYELEHLPPCDDKHVAQPPDHQDEEDDPQGSYGGQDEEQPSGEEENNPPRGPDDRPEIGSAPCPHAQGIPCSNTPQVKRKARKKHRHAVTEDDPAYMEHYQPQAEPKATTHERSDDGPQNYPLPPGDDHSDQPGQAHDNNPMNTPEIPAPPH
jgi:hypothetical protein